MNLRIKKIRKALDLTQREFAKKLGMKQNTIATYEMGRCNPSEPAIVSICREFNVNEKWLRTGIGNMFNAEHRDDISEIVDKYNLSLYGEQIIRTYIEMNDKQRSVIDDLNSPIIESEGSSIACAYFSGILALYLESKQFVDRTQIKH